MPPDVFLQLYNWAKFPNHRHVFAKHTVLLILVFNGLSYVFRQSLTLNSIQTASLLTTVLASLVWFQQVVAEMSMT